MNTAPKRTPGPAGPLPLAAIAALALAAAGCRQDAAIEMASIERVEPAVIEQGDVLRITGAGFVEGPARVTLSGAFDPSGLVPPEHRVVVIDGLAVQLAIDPGLDLANPYRVFQEMLAATIAGLPGAATRGQEASTTSGLVTVTACSMRA